MMLKIVPTIMLIFIVALELVYLHCTVSIINGIVRDVKSVLVIVFGNVARIEAFG